MSPSALPERPSGQQLVDVIHELAQQNGLRPVDVARKLSGHPWSFLKQVAQAKRPTPDMVARVRALLGPAEPPRTRPVRAQPCGRAKRQTEDAMIRDASGLAREVQIEALAAAQRRATARVRGSTENIITLARPAPSASVSVGSDPRPPAASREPCRRCATRGDLGCAHQRPFEDEVHTSTRSAAGKSNTPAAAETASVVNPDVPRAATPKAPGAVSEPSPTTESDEQ